MKLHEWNISPKEAIETQKILQKEVVLEPLKVNVTHIASADVSHSLFSKTLYTGVIVFTYPELIQVDYALVKMETTFPYIPGLLSFREAPGIVECFAKLKVKPDVLVVDGQGIAHPRRLGIASHVGIILDIPTVGCAKNILLGIFDRNLPIAPIYDKDEIIGTALITKKNCKPIIISPGHKITLSESVEIIQSTLKGYRLPEIIRKVHELVNKFRIGEITE